MIVRKVICIPVLLLLLSNSVTTNRIWQSIYEDLDATYSCFKIMNGTHEFGCTADFSGNVGLLRLVNSSESLAALTSSGEQHSVVAVLPRQQFTVDTLQQLEEMTADPDQGDVKGVILMLPDEAWGPNEPFQYSEDDTCPNRWSSFYRSDPSSAAQFDYCLSKPWNPAGTGMFKRSWTFPIILLKNQTQIDNLLKCHQQYNAAGPAGDWPRCAAQLKTLMYGAGSTEVCWRRTQDQYINTKASVFCSPMGSTNVFGTWAPRGGPAPPAVAADTVLVAARTDGATMFDALAPGADSAAVAMVTLLAVARALAELPPPPQTRANVMFMLFSGESFDYIGSDRMVYDMAADKFPPSAVPADDEKAGSVRRPPPLKLADVQYYLELNQLARGSLYMHSDPVSRGRTPAVDDKVKQLIAGLTKYGAVYNVSLTESVDTPLPPSSLHALLRGNDTVPGLVLTDHQQGYTNSFFHSVYDVKTTVTGGGEDWTELAERIARLTQVVTSAVYGVATEQQAPTVTVDTDWVEGLLECYMERANCSLFRDVMDVQMEDKKLTKLWQLDVPLPTYVSVASQGTMHSSLMRLTKNLLSRWTGVTLQNVTSADKCKDDADRVFAHRWLVRQFENGSRAGYCTRSLVAEALASSPAFEIPDYDWSSGEHPSWAESQWTGFQLRVFLKPSLGHELAHLLLGLAVTLVAIGAVLLVERRSHLLFDSPRYELQS